MTIGQAIYRAAWIALVAFLVWVFKQPAYLPMLIILPWLGKAKEANRTMKEHFDELGFKFDALTNAILTANSKQNTPPKP